MHVGTTVLTRILYGPSSRERWETAPMMADFDAAYAAWGIWDQYIAWLPMNTTDPPRSFRWGIAAPVICIVPKRLTSSACRQVSQSAFSRPPNTASRAAQLTSASTRPKRSNAVAASRSHWAASVMSVTDHAT